MPTRAPNKTKLTILRARHLGQIPWLLHGFSTRAGGSSRPYGKGDLNLGFTKDDSRAAVERNRTAFLREIGAVNQKRRNSKAASRKAAGPLWPLITLRQIHSDIIHTIDSVPTEQLAGDGMITATPGLLLGILLWNGRFEYDSWRALFTSGAFRSVTFVFMLAVFYHAWVGMRNILMDYVKPVAVRLILQVLVICALLGYVGWTIQILWGGPA